MDYRFPGNVRELENIIEKSVALETSNIVLPEDFSARDDESNWADILNADLPESGVNLNDIMVKIEKDLIQKALVKSKGSKSKAAALLNVSADSFRYRIEKLGI